jgi:hypothetical protein
MTVLSVVSALVVASCGGGAVEDDAASVATTEAAESEVPPAGAAAQRVASADGSLELAISAGAIDSDGGVTITAASAPDLEEEGFDLHVYDLAPSGLTFAAPAVVTLRIPSTGATAFPVVFVALEDESGVVEQLPAEVFTDGAEIVVESEIEHFSRLAFWVSGEEVPITNGCPTSMVVGESCEISVDIPSYGEPDADLDFTVGFDAASTFEVVEGPGYGATYTCTAATDSAVEMAQVHLNMPATALFFLFMKFGAEMRYQDASDSFSHFATCSEPEPGALEDDDPTGGLEGAVVASVADPEGDFLTAEDLSTFPQLEENPPAGIDITDVTVAYAPGGDTTIITVRFAGSFRELEADETRRLVLRPIFRRDGSYNFEIEYLGGPVFVSGGPEGASVEMEWLNDRTVRFTLQGFAPIAGDGVRISVFSEKEAGDGKAVQGDRADVDITE